MKQRRIDNGRGIYRLWLNWLLGSGTITLLVILSLWLRPIYLPFVAFGFQFILFMRIRANRRSRLPICYILPFVVSRILFWSGTVMLVINILYTDHFVESVFDITTINRDIPFIVLLIIAPITMIVSGWNYIHRHDNGFCHDCKIQHGTPAERGFLGIIYTQIGHYQLGMLFCLSTACTVIGWAYYAVLYVNESLSDPDRFIFFWLPTLLWLACAIYLGLRYLGIWGYYCQNVEGSMQRQGSSTQLRYILIWDNYICLRNPETDIDRAIIPSTKFDTPITAFIHKIESLNKFDADIFFANMSGIKHADVRFMYSTTNGNVDCNIFHFLCFLTDNQKDSFTTENPDCRWYNMNEIADMINSKRLNPLMSSEIVRLHTIAMAWKTYTADGRRRYKIKHYKPTFHIRDIHKWDVDYNNVNWLYVAAYNQDTPFYCLRRFYRKYINGIGC